MVSLLHEDTSKTETKIARYHAPWLKDGIFAVTNIQI